jgi:hypothetical protein
MALKHRVWMLPLLLLAVGCPDEEEPEDEIEPPECEADSECRFARGLEICEAGACIEGDRNNGPEDAQLLEPGDVADLYIAPAGDVDWFRFQGTAGDLVRILTTADETEDLDTVIRYFDADANEIGFNDDWTRIGSVPPDARLHTGVADTGIVYFTVEDRRSWINDPTDPPEGGDDFRYEASFQNFDQLGGTTVGIEADDTPAQATPWVFEEPNFNYTVGGFLGVAGDVDWYAIPVVAGEAVRLYGVPNNGTAATPTITPHYQRGEEFVPIRTYYDLSLDSSNRGYIPILETGNLLLAIEDATGGGGNDHWYVWHGAKNPAADGFPPEVEPNDQPVEATTGIVDGPESVAFWGRIDPAGDVDHYALEAEAGDRLSVNFETTEHDEPTRPGISVIAPDGTVEFTVEWSIGDPPPTLLNHELTQSGRYTVQISEQDPASGGGNYFYQVHILLLRP